MTDARLYAKIMRYQENVHLTSWDFRTLNLTHTQLCGELRRSIMACDGIDQDSKDHLMSRYVPRRLWAFTERM